VSKVLLILFVISFLIINLKTVNAASATYTECNTVGLTNSTCIVPYHVIQGGDDYGLADFDAGNCNSEAGYSEYGSFNNNNNSAGVQGKGYYGGAVEGAQITSDGDEEQVSGLNSDVAFSQAGNGQYYQYSASKQQANDPSYLSLANMEQNTLLTYNGSGQAGQTYGYKVYNNGSNSPPNLTSTTPSTYTNFGGVPQNSYGGDFGDGTLSNKQVDLPSQFQCLGDPYGNITNSTTPAPTLISSSLSTGSFHFLGNGGNLGYGHATDNGPVDSIDIGTLTPGNYYLAATAGGTNPSSGNAAQLIIYDSKPLTGNISIAVNGDAYIAQNITYCYNNSACGTSSSNIPQFQLSVEGYQGFANISGFITKTGFKSGYTQSSTIFVANNVTEIHGFFTAQSAFMPFNQYEEGTFETCANLSGYNIEPQDSYAPQVNNASASTCDNQLNIYGSVEAGYIFPARTYGNLNSMTHTDQSTDDGLTTDSTYGQVTNASNAAEVFRYSPELWIPDASSECVNISTCIQSSYSSETSLPPVY
jgi:hypothetical protein